MYPQVFGKYVLERELARGGMARVLLATLRGAGGFEKKLVVKQIRDELSLDDAFVRRFVDEAKTTVALSHPNIVPVYELGVELGTYYLAMEYVEGMSAAELLRACSQAGERPTPEEVAYVGVEICRALDYAHRRVKIVHRDVTPRNVMIDEEGQVKVIDFGIAALALVGKHEVFGSPGHMPPEQTEGQQLSPATDVFAVAVLLMELWTGKPPFRRRDAKDVEAAMRGSHPKPSEFDARLAPVDDVILRAMSLDPAARPQDADELSRALRKFLSNADLGDVARQLGERVRRMRKQTIPKNDEKRPTLERPPSRGSAAEIRTKTFAAREEIRAWKPDGTSGATPASTRKLDSTPEAPLAAPSESKPPEIETIATRPIETDGRSNEATPRRRNLAWLGLLGAAALAVGTFFIGRANQPRTTTPTFPTGSAIGATTAPSATIVTTAALSTSTNSSASVLPTPTRPAPNLSTSAPTAVDSSARAQLTLLGEGTVVSVDGVSRGMCPTQASVEPGKHTVVFRFPATGEAKGEDIRVRPGEKVMMRADFTGATPTLRIQR
jgi:serine/threonine-protein kinase